MAPRSHPRIVVGIDAATPSRRALSTAIDLARSLDAEVIALHVVADQATVSDHSDVWHSGEDAADRALERLQALLAEIPEAESVRLAARVHSGDPARVLTDQARELGAGFLCVGPSGASQGGADGIGSVTRELLTTAPCPVVVVPEDEASRSAPCNRAQLDVDVADVMRREVLLGAPDAHLAEAQRLTREAGIHQLPGVVAGELLGIVSGVDLERQSGYLERTKVDAVMTPRPLTVDSGARLSDAIRILLDEDVNSLPVVRAGALVGMLSRTDVLRLAARWIMAP